MENDITPETIKKNVQDVLEGLYKGDTDLSRVTATVDKPLVGANLLKHLETLKTEMLEAAENLEFEEAARIRDEVRRLETVELAISNDPLARQSAIDAKVQKSQKIKGRSQAGRAGTINIKGNLKENQNYNSQAND